MKQISPRTFHGYALFVAVVAYLSVIVKLFTTGWIENVTTTTLIVTLMIIGAIGMVLWNLIVNFRNSKKETKK